MATPTRPRLLTAEEFMALPDDPEGRRMELYNGEVIYMPPPGEEHSDLSGAVYDALKQFVTANRLGKVNFEMGFRIRAARVVAPDVAFVANSDLGPRDKKGAFPGSPTLAVEVVSPSDIDRDTEDKAGEYIDAGSKRAWLVRPSSRTVSVFYPDGIIRRFKEGEVLRSAEAGFEVDGFELAVGDLFAAAAQEPADAE